MSKDLITAPSIAYAAELARNGDYAEAEQMLRELGGRDSTDLQVLDLLARIHAQRGELYDADECWAVALRLDATFAPALAGRQRIAVLVARRLRPRTGRIVLIVALAAVMITGTGVAGSLLTPRPPGTDPAVLGGLEAVQNNQREQAERLDKLDGRLERTASKQQRTLDELIAALKSDPALLARVDAGAVVVTFPAGLFRTRTRLSDTGTTALASLAQRLAPFAADVSLTVVGHTEDVPVARNSGYANNTELGVARATTAAERMSAASGIPLAAFALSSSGEANPPFPNTTAEGRARNRTVTVVLRPR